MQKRSMLWLLSIAAASTVCITNGRVYGAAGSYNDGKVSGENAGALAVGTYGTKQLINQNISMPMMQNGTMTTVDGSKSFNGAIAGPSSNKFIIVTIEPAATGDLTNVTIAQDLDKDGALDSTHVVSVPVSGVCANGFISCTPGTWSNCSAYKWVSDANGAVSEAAGSLTGLGGCYCINSSCGSNIVWTNSAIILDGIGGGIVSAIHDNDPSLMITSVDKSMTTITYYGSLPTKTITAAPQIKFLESTPAIVDLSSYYSNPSGLTNTRDSMAMNQSSDSKSLYSLITGVGNKAVAKTGSCSITRAGAINSKSDSFYYTGNTTMSTDHNIYYEILELSPNKDYALVVANSNQGSAIPVGATTIKSIVLPTSPSTSVKLTKAFFSMDVSGSGCNTASASIDGLINGFGVIIPHVAVCGASGSQIANLSWSSLFEFTKDDYTETIIDDCSTYASDLSCKVKNEVINGVITIRDYNPTGLNPLGTCNKFLGQTMEMEICRPWWEKKREYVCQNGTSYDFSDVSKRFGKVISSTAGGSGLSFTDTTKDKDGAWNDKETTGISLPIAANVSTCEPACKTRIASQDTQVGLTGSVTSMRKDGADNYAYAYRPCINNTCPVQPGEEILLDCQCINEFAQAAVIIQTLRLSGNDNICSSGSKSPMKP